MSTSIQVASVRLQCFRLNFYRFKIFQILKKPWGSEDDLILGSYQHNDLELVFAVNGC